MFVNDINYQCCQLQQIYGFSPSEIGIKYNWMQLFSAAELSQIIQQIADIYYFKTIPGIRMNEALCISSVLSNTPTPPVLFSLRNKITATSLPDLQLSNKYQLNWVFPGQLMMVKGTSSSVFLHSLDSTCTWNLTNYVLYMYIWVSACIVEIQKNGDLCWRWHPISHLFSLNIRPQSAIFPTFYFPELNFMFI